MEKANTFHSHYTRTGGTGNCNGNLGQNSRRGKKRNTSKLCIIIKFHYKRTNRKRKVGSGCGGEGKRARRMARKMQKAQKSWNWNPLQQNALPLERIVQLLWRREWERRLKDSRSKDKSQAQQQCLCTCVCLRICHFWTDETYAYTHTDTYITPAHLTEPWHRLR